MSGQIRAERKHYYEMLEKTQKGSLDITEWLDWYINCLESAIDNSSESLISVIQKSTFWKANSNISLNDRQRKVLNMLLEGFESKLTSSKWAKLTKCSQDTATRDIQFLIDKNILKKDSAGGRSTSYSLVDF